MLAVDQVRRQDLNPNQWRPTSAKKIKKSGVFCPNFDTNGQKNVKTEVNLPIFVVFWVF
jgi:hypothetical protein